MCNFNLAWIGQCKQNGEPYCKEHEVKKCVVCGKQATHECDETAGAVCGADLCDDCEHEVAPNGTNGGNFKHCKKCDQKHTPWWITHDQEAVAMWKEARGIVG